MYLNYTVLTLLFVLPFLNLVILFFISAFLVRFRIDLMNFLTGPLTPKVATQEPDLKREYVSDVPGVRSRPKTWDEKYEEEVELVSKRLRQSANGDL